MFGAMDVLPYRRILNMTLTMTITMIMVVFEQNHHAPFQTVITD